jgi:hypothetical protein
MNCFGYFKGIVRRKEGYGLVDIRVIENISRNLVRKSWGTSRSRWSELVLASAGDLGGHLVTFLKSVAAFLHRPGNLCFLSGLCLCFRRSSSYKSLFRISWRG